MTTPKPKTTVALVDDHVLLRRGLAEYIRTLDAYEVVLEASDGRDLIHQLAASRKPDLLLLDIHMPAMDGYDTALWLSRHHPEIKVLALSVSDREQSVMRMIRNGAKGYVLKDIDPLEFKNALDELVTNGFYFSTVMTGKLLHAMQAPETLPPGRPPDYTPNERELTFLRLLCSELTYKEIAGKMSLSARTIDGYRDDLFDKLQVRTRVGLVLYAIKERIVVA